jgi:hypothetical protein
MLYNANTTSYVFGITKTLEFMKNEKKNSTHSKLWYGYHDKKSKQ